MFFGGGSTFHAPNRGAGQKAWGFSATASEDANYTATLVHVTGPTGGSPTTVDQTTGLIHAYFTPAIKLQTASHPAGYYMLTLTLTRGGQPGAHHDLHLERLQARDAALGRRDAQGCRASHGHQGKHHRKPKKTKHHH